MSDRQIDAKFEITGWDETAYDEPAHGPKLTRVTIRKQYSGVIEGTSVAEVLTAQGTEGQAYVASERVEGMLEGRGGSFVIQHGGVAGPEGRGTFGQIVPGSGTGALAGIAGEAVEAEHEVLTLRLRS